MGSNRGILMHISSLPSPYGIGNLGKEAYEFVDFLKRAGQDYWQILPQNPTGFGDSPYQSASAFAGNPYFIDIDALLQEGLLEKSEVDNYFFGGNRERVDYGKIFFYRYPLLRCAYFRFSPNREYEKFIKENAYWLDEYALFMALKEDNHYQSWLTWEDDIKNRDKKTIRKARIRLKKIINFYKFVQYKFFEQWEKLKAYANSQGIKIIGDMPIYVAMDSAEVWSDRKLFMIDDENHPQGVAAYPRDGGYINGQVWGNPLYNWDEMKKQNFKWWVMRFGQAQKMYDLIRIDHFCGFFKYYSVEENAHDARGAAVHQAPGEELFSKVAPTLNVDVIAENMGISSPEMKRVMDKYHFMGMNILQLEVDLKTGERKLPGHDGAYTGNHDNNTILGWYNSLSENKKRVLRRTLGIKAKDNPVRGMISAVLNTNAPLKIIPIQDYLEKDREKRMNIPCTVGGNWVYRVKKEELTGELADYIRGF